METSKQYSSPAIFATPSPNLTTAQAAEILGVRKETLEQMRWRGTGPKFVKIGRSCRYRAKDLEEYQTARTFISTTEAQQQV